MFVENTVCRRAAPIILQMILSLSTLLSLVSCRLGAHAADTVHESQAWSPSAELAWYEANVEPKGQNYSMIYSSLASFRNMADFQNDFELIESQLTGCDSWVVYQSVNLHAEEGLLRMLCKVAGAWKVVSTSTDESIIDHDKETDLDILVSSASDHEVFGMPCHPVLGPGVEYMALFHRGRITYRAMYAREADRQDCKDALNAKKIEQQFELLAELLKRVP